MMWLWRWLFPAQPMPGQAWRFHSGDEVAITHVQPEDLPYEIVQSGDSFNDYVRYHGAFVRYRTADGECHKAPYKGFARSGQPVPTYLPVEAT